jgi:hypothetical protein
MYLKQYMPFLLRYQPNLRYNQIERQNKAENDRTGEMCCPIMYLRGKDRRNRDGMDREFACGHTLYGGASS